MGPLLATRRSCQRQEMTRFLCWGKQADPVRVTVIDLVSLLDLLPLPILSVRAAGGGRGFTQCYATTSSLHKKKLYQSCWQRQSKYFRST
jgi:hypothetical protein